MSLNDNQEVGSKENTEEAKEATTDNEGLPKENEEKQDKKEGIDETPENSDPGEESEDDIPKTSEVSEIHESELSVFMEEDEEDEESGLSFIEDLVYDTIPSETTIFMVDSEKTDIINSYRIAFPDNSFIQLPEVPPPPPVKDYSVEQRHSDISVVLKPHYGLKDADDYSTDIKQYLTRCKILDAPVVMKVVEGLHKHSINLKYYGVHNESVPAITEALANNPHVRKLSLEDTWLNIDAAVPLGKMLEQNKVLTHLILKNCRLGPKGMEALKMGIRKTQNLKVLDLTGNDIGDEGIEPLGEAMTENWSITTLMLSNNNLGIGAAQHLANFLLENWSIMDLDLSVNDFYTAEAMKPLMKGMGKNKSVTRLNLSWNGLCMPLCAKHLQHYLRKSTVIETLDLSYNRLEGAAIKMIKNGCLKSSTLQTLILDNNPITPDDALAFLQGLTKPDVTLAEISMKEVWVNKEFLQALEAVRNIRPIKVSIGGVYSNYIIYGPDEKKLLLARATYECTLPKSKKKRRNFGYFVLKLQDKPIRKSKFRDLVSTAKLPVAPNLIEQLMKQFKGKRRKVDQKALKEYYLKLYPDTKLPEKKKKKKHKGKRKKGKKGKSSDSDTGTSNPTTSDTETTETATSEPTTSQTETTETATSEPTTSQTETTETATSEAETTETSASEADTDTVVS